MRLNMNDQATAISIRELKAKVSEILRKVESSGEEVVITRRGKPCGKLVPIKPEAPGKKKSLRTLRGAFKTWPDLEFEEIQEAIREMWKGFPRPLPDEDE
jgi:prevent-host-death family protein